MALSSKPKKWKWIVAAMALLLAVMIEGWALKKQGERVCRSAVELAHHSEALGVWISEAEADPFLGSSAMRGPVNSVIAEFRNRSRWIQSEFSARFLPEQARQAFIGLNTAGDSPSALLGPLQGVANLKPLLKCDGRNPAGEESGLSLQVVAANEFWRDQKAHAALAKVEFEKDRVIYCKGDDLLKGLQKVVTATAGRCMQKKLPPKLAQACMAGKEGAVELEIADLNKQKEFNLRKLRNKWPESVLKAALQCS